MLTPHVITGLNRFIRDEKAVGMNIHYDAQGRLLRVESLDDRGHVINEFRRVHLASWITDPCDAFVEWAGIEAGGGTLYYSPEGAAA